MHNTKNIEYRKNIKKELEKRRELKKKRKKKKVIRRVISILIILLIVLVIPPVFLISSFISSIDNGGLIEGVAPLSNQSLNILILGLDSGDVVNVENTNSKKTDTIMVLNYNRNTEKINLISIPRDTLIEVNAYYGSNELRRFWKINNACVLGGDEEMIKQVENLLEIDVNYMVKIDYQALRHIIDSIGGIEMYIEQDMFYDDESQDLHINFNAGETILLNGVDSEKFLRWRKNNDGSGLANADLGRINNQQKFIKEVIKKITKPSIVFTIPQILDVIKEYVHTNMPANEIMYYGVKLLFNDGIYTKTLEGESQKIYKESFLVVDKEENRKILDPLQSSYGLNNASSNEYYNILVLNATNIDGLAFNTKKELEKNGYKNIETGNLKETKESLIISNNKKLKKQLKEELGITTIKANEDYEYSNYDAVIVIGENYI